MDSNQTIHLKPMYSHPHLSLYNTPVISVTMPNLSLSSSLNITDGTNESNINGTTNETSNNSNVNALAAIQSAAAAVQTNSAHLVPVTTNNVCLNNIQIQQLHMHQQSFSENHQLQTHCNSRGIGGGSQQTINNQMLQLQLANPMVLPSSSSIDNCYNSSMSRDGPGSKANILQNDTNSSLSNESSTSTQSDALCSKSEINNSSSSTKRVTSNNQIKEMDISNDRYVNLARATSSINNSSAISMKLNSDNNYVNPSLRVEVNNNNDSLNTHGKGFKCQLCDRDFTQKGNLKTHLMTHSGERPYECPTCGKNFTQKGNLDTHVKIHTETKDHKCQYCDRGFTQRGNLKTHIRSIHTKEKPYACGHCGKSFSQKGNMLTHYRTHDKEARFPCNVCGKTFSQKVRFSLRHLSHVICNQIFVTNSNSLNSKQGNLKTHQQRHGRGSAG